jgi:hypothetical protein
LATPDRVKRLPSERILLGAGRRIFLGRLVEYGARVGALVESRMASAASVPENVWTRWRRTTATTNPREAMQ